MAQRTLKNHNRFVVDSLEEGDLIQFDRGIYSHWAVYAGDEKVIHLTGIGRKMVSDPGHSISISGVFFNRAVVMIENFWTVAGNSKATKNNSNDRRYRSFGASDIVKRALSKIGSLSYSILCNNCEHFACWCRYGSQISEQADKVVTAGVITGTVAVVALMVFSWFENDDE